MREREKDQILMAKRKTIEDVLEEVEVVFDMNFKNFSKTKSSICMKRVIANQSAAETKLLKRTWSTQNFSQDLDVYQRDP